MRRSKGQVTLYLIIAILILFLIGGFLLFAKYLSAQKANKEISGLNNLGASGGSPKKYIDECIKAKIAKGADLLGIQGGYVFPPNSFLDSNYSKIGYGLYQNKITLPSLEKIENELEHFVANAAKSCLNYSLFGY